MNSLQTGINYQMYMGLGLLVLGSLESNFSSKSYRTGFVSFNENLDKNIPVLVGKTSKKDKKYKEKVQELRTFAKQGGYVVFFEVLGKRVPGFARELKEMEAETLP